MIKKKNVTMLEEDSLKINNCISYLINKLGRIMEDLNDNSDDYFSEIYTPLNHAINHLSKALEEIESLKTK